MEASEQLKQYFPIADYIAAVNGKNCEVLIHDVRDINESICYIVNGHVTNRSIGGSITNFALELLQKREYLKRESFTNYTGTTKDGKKILRSSTYFIKDGNQELIGLLCVNIDITDLLRMQDTVGDLLLRNENTSASLQRVPERFDVVVDDIVQETIDAVVLESGLKLLNSTIDEKRILIRKMESKGVFKFKGAVNTVANVLGVSAQTIYRYLQSASKEREGSLLSTSGTEQLKR
ncbi:MAG: helix-turn-helix transcriptional regulator [Spirochaetota bacterium]